MSEGRLALNSKGWNNTVEDIQKAMLVVARFSVCSSDAYQIKLVTITRMVEHLLVLSSVTIAAASSVC